MADFIEGLKWATDQGAQMIIMSFGRREGTSIVTSAEEAAAEEAALKDAAGKGVLLVGGAGNDGAPSVMYPAAYDEVIAVGATDSDDQLASYSNRGSALDVAAPGG